MLIVLKNWKKRRIFDFAKEEYFEEKALGKKSTRHKAVIRLPKLPAIKISGNSTRFLTENPIELCERTNLLKEKPVGNNSETFNGKIVAITNKLLEYKCISTKHHRFCTA